MGAINGIKIYREPNVMSDEDELNHPSTLEKIGCIADGEDVGVRQNGEVFAHAFTLSGTKEDDRTGFCAGYIREVFDVNGQVIDA